MSSKDKKAKTSKTEKNLQQTRDKSLLSVYEVCLK